MAVVAPSVAMAHGRMVVPLNRSKASDANNTDTDGGFLTGVCGGVAKPATASFSYAPGSTISVTMETTIPHTGSVAAMEEFDFYWSPTGDAGAGLYNGVAGPTPIMKYIFTKPAAASTHTATLTLPNAAATNGTLQMVMVDDDQVPAIYWYSCVDVTLSADVANDGGETMDLSAPGMDLSAAVDAGPQDLASAPPVDMRKRPNAEKATLPGCSMAPGSSPGNQAAVVFGFLLLAFVARRMLVRVRRG
jgi:hypothetical protein